MDAPRFGIIGSDGATRRWAQALAGRDDVQLAAISDRDAGVCAELGETFRAAHDDDPRTLLVHCRLDVVIFASAPSAGDKIIPMAAEQDCAVIIDAPPSRTYEEALTRLALFERSKRPVLVRSGW